MQVVYTGRAKLYCWVFSRPRCRQRSARCAPDVDRLRGSFMRENSMRRPPRTCPSFTGTSPTCRRSADNSKQLTRNIDYRIWCRGGGQETRPPSGHITRCRAATTATSSRARAAGGRRFFVPAAAAAAARISIAAEHAAG